MDDKIVVDPTLPLDPVTEPGPLADPVEVDPPNPVFHAIEQRSFGRAPGVPMIVTTITGA